MGDMAMNAWFLRLTPGLPILADNMNLLIQSWKKILKMGVKKIYPAHGMDFPVGVIEKENRGVLRRESEHSDFRYCFDRLDFFVVPA